MTVVIKLVQEDKSIDKQTLPTPIASFIVRVLYPFGSPKLARYEYTDVEISKVDGVGFRTSIGTLSGKTPITLSLEFLDLKVALENDCRSHSIWDEECLEQNSSNEPLNRMLSQNIYTDVVINTIDGSIETHRAILATHSSVFKMMHSNNYKEKETSTINLKNMSTETCKAMLNFSYGKKGGNELRAHKMELVATAHLYDMAELKDACDASLCEDVGSKNVFERFKCASTYDLPNLNSACLFYLIKMGTIFELREDYNSFLQEADPIIIAEVSNACLDAW